MFQKKARFLRVFFIMDNVTHTLTGLVARDIAPKRLFENRHFLWMSLLAANAPDIDIALMPFGLELYLKYHRGITHSLFLVPIWGLIAAILVYYISKKRVPFLDSWLWLSIMVSIHDGVDWITSYGTGLLTPFSQKAYSANLFPIFDPWFFLLLTTVCLIVKYRPKRRKAIVFIGIAIFLLYGGLRAYCKSHSERLVEERFGPMAQIYSFADIENVGAWINPTMYRVVAVRGGMASSYEVSPLEGRTDFQRAFDLFDSGDEYWEKVDSYGAARAFIERSNLPVVEVQDGVLVLSDLRYSAGIGQTGGLALYFEMENGEIMGKPSIERPR